MNLHNTLELYAAKGGCGAWRTIQGQPVCVEPDKGFKGPTVGKLRRKKGGLKGPPPKKVPAGKPKAPSSLAKLFQSKAKMVHGVQVYKPGMGDRRQLKKDGVRFAPSVLSPSTAVRGGTVGWVGKGRHEVRQVNPFAVKKRLKKTLTHTENQRLFEYRGKLFWAHFHRTAMRQAAKIERRRGMRK